jgi:hypothetical protein
MAAYFVVNCTVNSPEYQAVIGKRFEATEGFGRLADGV